MAGEAAVPRMATPAPRRPGRRAGRLAVRVGAVVAATDPGGSCCRRAELATWIALRGRLHVSVPARAAGAPAAVVIDVPSLVAAERLCGLVRAMVGAAGEVLLAAPPRSPAAAGSALSGSGGRGSAGRGAGSASVVGVWTVIVRPAGQVVTRAGMLTRTGQLRVGLPAPVLHGRVCCAAAAWRTALLATPPAPERARPPTARASGRDADPGGDRRARPARLVIDCPNPVVGVALIGLARRLGASHARLCAHPGGEQLQVTQLGAITTLLTAVAGPDAAAAFPPPLSRTAKRAGRRGVGSPTAFGDVNTNRARSVAARTVAQVQEAFAVLDGHPGLTEPLRAAGQLRLAYPQLSLAELAARSDPPLSKDTLAGRLRRLLELAERHARSAGHPSTGGVVHPVTGQSA